MPLYDAAAIEHPAVEHPAVDDLIVDAELMDEAWAHIEEVEQLGGMAARYVVNVADSTTRLKFCSTARCSSFV